MAVEDVHTGVVAFCGNGSFLETCRACLASVQVVRVSPDELMQLGREGFPNIVALVLTLENDTGSRGRTDRAISAEPGLEPPPALDLMARLHEFPARLPVVLLAQSGTPLELCCSAVQLGVTSFIDPETEQWQDRLAALVQQLQTVAQVRLTGPRFRNPKELLDAVGIMAISPAMQELIVLANRASQVSDATVLIHGESGTGKQLLAEAIHRLDPKRSRYAFVPVNCAAITGTLAESELFGHVRGAFTGATEGCAGYFRSASRGTILLDEISELPLYLQPKLLRVLQEGRVLPVGADREDAVDVRVIAASNVSLQEKVAAGTFRLDLYQRLNVIHLTVPPLRQRAEDIPLLVMHFMKKYEHYTPVPVREVDVRVFELLKRRVGDGNVRELENLIRQALVFKAGGTRLELSDLPRYLLEGKDVAATSELIPSPVADHLVNLIKQHRLTLRQAMDAFERTLIRTAAKTSPTLSKVELAKTLGLPRRTLYYKMDDPKS